MTTRRKRDAVHQTVRDEIAPPVATVTPAQQEAAAAEGIALGNYPAIVMEAAARPSEPEDTIYEEIVPSTYAAIIAGYACDMGRLAMRVLGRP